LDCVWTQVSRRQEAVWSLILAEGWWCWLIWYVFFHVETLYCKSFQVHLHHSLSLSLHFITKKEKGAGPKAKIIFSFPYPFNFQKPISLIIFMQFEHKTKHTTILPLTPSFLCLFHLTPFFSPLSLLHFQGKHQGMCLLYP